MSARRQQADILSGVEEKITGSKFVDNNTVEYTTETGERRIRLHDTDILRFLPSGTVILSSGGWKTVTTKDRFNKFLPSGYGVYQENSVWYLTLRGETVCVFRDGMRLRTDGSVDGVGSEKAVRELVKKIAAYCSKVGELEKLPLPSSGDCWYCLMVTEEGVSLGDSTGDTEHLMKHLEEQHIHGSLVRNALRAAGYSEQATGYMFRSWQYDSSRDSVARAVRRYFKRQLGLPE